MVQVWKRTNEGLQKGVERNDSRYDEDLNDALEGIKYMKDLVRGTADIAPVVAKPQTVIEYSHCGKLALSHLTEIGWVENEDFYLFSAYYDRRMNSLFPANHIVQVLGMHYRTFNKTLFCTLQSPYTSIVVRAGVREIWQRAWDPRDHFYIPYLISCPVPRRLREEKDLIVAVSTDQCLSKSTTALIVHFYPRESQNPTGKVAVCVKGLDFLDNEQS
ncbi:hypothetical protein L596_024534 [Steinernema carpocapsae]|uniref:Uncharacterized protein n=1 Tax=Steinernema carpocapsae TaxID=34508 RepID=A0A4U5MGZ7_STECR|nr:hypothetical protein L596_024534 [Steinernema carpocapsae]